MSNPNQTQQAKAPRPRKPSRGFWISLTLALVALGAGYLYLQKSASQFTSAESEPASSNPEPKEEAGSTPQTGSLVIRANVTGATVFLDGKPLGEAPQSVKELKPGRYQVKVEKAGYKPFEKQVQLTAARRVLQAQLAPITDELASGSPKVKVDLPKPSALSESVAVKHKHGLPTRSCDGVLRATTEGIEYSADNEDRFTADFSNIERLEFKGKNLNLKIRDGRNYSFTERNGNPTALAAFYDEVKAAIDKMRQAAR